jgi:hypothetical protein
MRIALRAVIVIALFVGTVFLGRAMAGLLYRSFALGLGSEPAPSVVAEATTPRRTTDLGEPKAPPAGNQDVRPAPTAAVAPASAEDTGAATATVDVIATLEAPAEPAALLQQVADIEAKVRAGEFEATLDYGNGDRTVTILRFDLNDTPRYQLLTTYYSADGTRNAESVLIGDQAWERQPDDTWLSSPNRGSVSHQVRSLLPGVNPSLQAEISAENNQTIISWYDAQKDEEFLLSLDSETNIPIELRQTRRATRSVLTVIYKNWNAPMTITAPEGAE